MPTVEQQYALIVDDRLASQRACMLLVEREGFVPVAASTRDEALRGCLEFRPAVVVLELSLPDGDGMDLLARLRHGGAEDAAIIVVTSLTGDDLFDRALALGADDFLRKPCANDELRVSLRAVLRVRRAEAAARQHARHMEVIARAGSVIGAANDLESALRALLEAGAELTGGDRGILRLRRDANSDDARAVRSYRWNGGAIFEWEDETPNALSNTARVFATGQAIYADDLEAEALAGNDIAASGLHRYGIRSSLNVPLLVSGHVVGTFHIDSQRARAFQSSQLAPLQLLADYAAAAIERVRLKAVNDEHAADIKSIMAGARCLLWHAVVLDSGRELEWDLRLSDEEAAQRLFQFDVLPGEHRSDAWYRSRLLEDRAASDACGQRAIRAGHAGYSHDFRCRRRDGGVIWITEDVQIASIGPGRWRLIGVCTETTERKQAELELERQYREAERTHSENRAILDASNEAMVLMSPDRRFLTVNPRFGALFGLDPSFIVGQRVDDVGEAALRGELERIMVDGAAALDTNAAHTRIVVQSWPVERELCVFSTMVFNSAEGRAGECLGRLHVIRDISREREVDRLKTEFVSLVSHELRTPLTSIAGYVDLLIDGEVGHVTSDQLDFLTIVKNNARRLVALINDLLDVSRIDAGKIELRRIPLEIEQVVADVVRSMQPQLEGKGQSVLVQFEEQLPQVVGDADRVAQIVANLLSNAHKYTPPNGHIWVTADAVGTMVQISVRDDGIGLTLDEQAQLFQKFFRANNPTIQAAGGTGLGLSITRSLVEMQGGTVSVESTANGGSTFSFTLPATPTARRPHQLDQSLAPTHAHGRILVVDDEPDVGRLIERYLESEGYETVYAQSGGDAIRLAQVVQPDLITLDLLLGDTDGLMVLEQLKADPTTAAIPVMLVSVSEDSGQGRKLGAVDYMVKPITKADLLGRVGAIIERGGGNGHRPLVLIADDESDVRGVLAGYLRRDGYDVIEAANGDQTISIALAAQPSLALIDVKMPGTDGIAALRALRSDVKTRLMPVVMMTASPSAYETSRPVVEALGGAAMMHKPLTAQGLATAIAKVLPRKEMA